METSRKLEALVDALGGMVETARNLYSPNPEDDLAIKVAIVGFSHNSPTSDWAHNHRAFVKSRLDGEYSIANLDFYHPNESNVQMFAALCNGYLLGLFQADALTEHDFRVAETLIPGIIALHSKKLTEP